MNYYHYHWNPAIILQSSLSSACITVKWHPQGVLMVEKPSSSKPTNAREKLQKNQQVKAKVQKGSKKFSLLRSFGPMDADSSNFGHCRDTLSLRTDTESALNLPLSVRCALAMTVRGQFGPLWGHCGSHIALCTYCDCILYNYVIFLWFILLSTLFIVQFMKIT